MDIKELLQNSLLISNRHPWEISRMLIIRKLLRNHNHLLQQNNAISIVDIGCGDTFLLKNLSNDYNHSFLYAIDEALSDELIVELKKDFVHESIFFYKSILELENPKPEKANIVLLLDVIEHIEADHDFMNNLINQPWIGKDTLIIVSAPAFPKLFNKHDYFLGHYRRYTKSSLNKLLRQNNIEVKDSGYFFFGLLIVRMLEKLSELVFPGRVVKQKGVGGWNQNKFISKLISGLLWTDFIVTSNFKKLHINLPGLSTYAICRKSV